MCWLNENISNINITESVILIERLLCEFLISRAESKKENQSEFVNFIKLVHSNELITFLNIRTVLKEHDVQKLYSGKNRICDKQMKPLGRTLCNFTSVAMQVTPNMARPDPSTCPCRHNSILFNTTDLFDGHVVNLLQPSKH